MNIMVEIAFPRVDTLGRHLSESSPRVIQKMNATDNIFRSKPREQSRRGRKEGGQDMNTPLDSLIATCWAASISTSRVALENLAVHPPARA